MNLILLGLSFFVALLLWQFCGYPILMALVSRTNHIGGNRSFQPFVSIIIPTYNERASIQHRIENLLELEYPIEQFEIIIVDSGSNDGTFDIAKNFEITETRNQPSIIAVSEGCRKGKASAINFGRNVARGEIILVTDANTLFSKNVLNEMMPLFSDEKVGAVGGRHVASNIDNPFAASEGFYLEIERIEREGEARMDSACLFHGEINAWRKEIVEADPLMLSEDLDMAIQIRRLGYKIEYAPNAVAFEPVPSSAKEQIVQRKRTSIGTIQNMFKHGLYFVGSTNWYGWLIFPSHKALPMVSPFIIGSILTLYILLWDWRLILIHIVLSTVIFACYLCALLTALNRSRGKEQRNQKHRPFHILYYVILNEYLIILAWIDFLSSKYSVKWEKVKSTR